MVPIDGDGDQICPTPWEPVSMVEVVNKVGAGAMPTNFKTSCKQYH